MVIGFAVAFDYLIRLSTIAVAFVGWSAIVVTLRRALGAELGALHMYFVRFFIEGGLAVAAFGLFPAALSLSSLGDSTIWRLSSAAAAVVFSVYFASCCIAAVASHRVHSRFGRSSPLRLPSRPRLLSG